MFQFKKGVDFILASASPRRLDLLQGLGLKFRVEAADIDETQHSGESPERMVERLSQLKAETIAQKYPSAWVLGADTTVVLDGESLGKPADTAEAERMLMQIQGRAHRVVGAFSLVQFSSKIRVGEVHISEVTIAPLSPSRIQEYIQTGEPLDKAGSYAIQGVGAVLVSAVSGSYTNVVGLNISAVLKALEKLQLLV